MGMTAPRRILPGSIIMVTLRCTQRRFRLAPSNAVNALVTYLVAVMSVKYRVGVVAMTWQSNHAHLVVVDHDARLPAMLQEMNGLLARGLNRIRMMRGSVFERNNVHMKFLVKPRSIFVALGYIAANPVAAGCVEFGVDWPGIRSQVRHIGRPGVAVKRPDHLFEKLGGDFLGGLPETGVLMYELPPSVASDERGQFIHLAEQAVHEAEEKARAENAAEGVRYLGRARCWNADPDLQGIAEEDHGEDGGSDLILATDVETKKEAQKELAVFYKSYVDAWKRWRDGDRGVVFPAGTWKMVRSYGANAYPPLLS